ncbi:MAG: mechanosensitive ion channel domain-containing protein [Pseudomonadota bacterium]
MLELIEQWLSPLGLGAPWANLAARAIFLGVILALSLAADFIARRVILRTLSRLIQRSRWNWDDALLQRKVLKRIGHFAPAVVIYLLAPVALEGYDSASRFVTQLVLIYMIVLGLLVLDAVLNVIVDVYRSQERSRYVPIRSFIQVIKLVTVFIGIVFIVSIILDKTPLYLLSGLGALTAVLMLVFKDAILGFVAGIQLTANRMVARGDWIEMAKYGADGDVLDVTLTTVKVQNWDKTITTIPTYALISDAFKNWRGMAESGGRRIKRAINIDMNSIRLCDDALLARLERIHLLRDYIKTKHEEIAAYNSERSFDEDCLVNGRRLTNVGTYRAYIVAFLRQHPMINQDMTFLVRQLAPTSQGLPLEIYVFSKDKVWANYEAIQADIFDHLLAVIHEFDLHAFQQPAGMDFRLLAEQASG